jgi:signal transduction histidine kinase
MPSLTVKLAMLLLAIWGGIALLIMVAVQVDPAGSGMSAATAIGGVALALLAVWCVLQPLVRRLARLVEALDSFEQGGFAPPLQVPGADPNGDEIARLAAQAERVGEHLGQQTTKLAHAAQRRREFLANVSHDLRTPLASMQGYLELLLLRHDSLEPVEARNYLQTAARQSERLARLVSDLFELNRLESGDLQPQAEAFVVAELAQDVVQKFSPDARRRDVKLDTCCDAARGGGGAMIVLADIGLIERVLENLVENALRHTPAGGAVTIEIGGHDGHAHMAVRDTGEGIAPEELPGVFERYDRAARVGGASGHAGLGLAIARRIVNLHGSPLRVQSEPGAGTRVSFELALAQPRPAAERRPDPVAQHRDPLPPVRS